MARRRGLGIISAANRVVVVTSFLRSQVALFLRNAIALLLLLTVFFGVAGAGAQPASLTPSRFAALSGELDSIVLALDGVALSDLDLADMRARLAAVIEEVSRLRTEASDKANEQRSLLAVLGPPPKADEEPESDEILTERRRIGSLVAAFEGRAKYADVLIARAGILGRAITSKGTRERAEGLLQRDVSLLEPGVWVKALGQTAPLLSELTVTAGERMVDVGMALPSGRLSGAMAGALLIALLLAWPLRNALLRRFGRDDALLAPSYARRLLSAVSETVARGLLPVMAALFVFVAVQSLAVVPERELYLVRIGLIIAALFFTGYAAVKAILASGAPSWRLLPMADAEASALNARLAVIAAVLAVSLFMHHAGSALNVPAELNQVAKFGLRVVLALTVLSLFQRRFWPDKSAVEAGAETSGAAQASRLGKWRLARLVALAIIVTNPILLATGYSKLADWMLISLVSSACAAAGFWILSRLLREAIDRLFESDQALLKLVRGQLFLTSRAAQRTRFWLRMTLDALLSVSAVLVILLILGLDAAELAAFLSAAVFGFSIGSLRFSLAAIGYAVMVFVGLIALTRVIQRFLERSLLPQTSLDIGAQNSIRTGVGYIGMVLAALAATSAIGVNLESLAIIAGALSIGVGFGLQNIVNNFVSGLILLIERPIKVGDWVEVGQHQGIVKRISVRATEVVTFQRASVIIPNSDLIAGHVVNWTFKDSAMRLDLAVGVAYGTDVAKVMDLLLACAKAHRLVLVRPEPVAVFMRFGESSLDFELRVHIADALTRFNVRSDLNCAIEQAFRDHGIEIPFPQRDLHIKDLDRIEALLGPRRRPGTAATGAESVESRGEPSVGPQ